MWGVRNVGGEREGEERRGEGNREGVGGSKRVERSVCVCVCVCEREREREREYSTTCTNRPNIIISGTYVILNTVASSSPEQWHKTTTKVAT